MIPKTIVVPLDGSELAERAVPVATPLAHHLGADVVLTSATYGDTRARSSYLDHVAVLSGDDGIERVVIADTEAVDAIEQTVGARPGAMVCMTTHGRGRLRWAVTGSVAEDVIRASTEPILLVGPRGEPSWSRPARRVVACVDGTEAGRAATRQACAWAHALDLQVHLVFATHPLDVESTEHPETIFEPFAEIVRAEGLAVHAEQLFRSSFLGGALADFAEEPPATLIVMAAHRHTGLARAVLGSTIMAVLNVASCPVLVVPAVEG